jgi:hypothetical protein
MKKIALLVLLLLSFVSFSAANTITMTSGNGSMSGTLGGSFPTYTLVLYGPNISFGTGSASDFPYTSGLQNCVECDPRAPIDLLIDSGIGSNQQGQFYNGLIFISAVSFVSSIAPNGMLTVTYKAFADIQFALCTDSSCDQRPTTTLVWDSQKLWLVTAQFAPDKSVLGTYDFLSATFQAPVVPEPSTMLLVGSGILALIGKVRQARTH